MSASRQTLGTKWGRLSSQPAVREPEDLCYCARGQGRPESPRHLRRLESLRHLWLLALGTVLLLAFLSVSIPAFAAPPEPLRVTATNYCRGASALPQKDMPYCYLRVTIENPRQHPVTCNLATSGWRRGTFAIAPQKLNPGERRTLHLALAGTGQSVSYLTVSDSDGLSDNANITGSESLFLVVTDTMARPTEKMMQDFSAEYAAVTGTNLSVGSRPPFTGPAAPMTTATAASVRSVVQCIEPAEAPDNWLCYTPFTGGVMVPESTFEAIPQGAKTALLQYVDMGGYLTLYQSDAPAVQRRLYGTLEKTGPSPVAARSVRRPPKSATPSWAHFYGQRDAALTEFPYDQREPAGRLGGLVLATAFFILAGPVNHFYFKRRGQIRRLMISVPVISLAFCLLLGIYFVATQGFTRKGGSVDLTVLDESRAAGLTIARHSVLSGLYPVGGFRFRADTAFYPLGQANDERSYAMDVGPVFQRLRSGLFRPSVAFHYATATPFASREKLVIDAAAGTVANGFETALRLVVVRQGGSLFLGRDIAPGGQGKLEPIESKGILSAVLDYAPWVSTGERAYVTGHLGALIEPLVAGAGDCYAALPEQTPGTLDAGVTITRGKACHLLVGIPRPGP